MKIQQFRLSLELPKLRVEKEFQTFAATIANPNSKTSLTRETARPGCANSVSICS